MSELVKLKDLCLTITDGSHYSPKAVKNGYPMLTVKDMGNTDFDFSNCSYIDNEEFEKMKRNGCVPHKGDVVIAKDGSYLKEVFVIQEDRDIAVLSSIGILRPDPTKLDPYYLKYYLSSDYVKYEVGRKYVSGSALPRIILKNFADIDIPYVPVVEQRKKVAVLKAIDKKISLNNAISSQLESLAKTLYDYWFLQFEFPNEEGKPYKSSGGKMVWCEELKREIPEGWNHGSLYDIADFVNGLACQKYRPIDSTSKLPVIKISEMHNGIGKDVEWARNDVPQKYIISDGDILFSWSATLETMIWTSGEGVLNQHIFKVNPKNANKYYVYQQLKSYVINFIRMAETRKTTMGHITTDHLKQSRIVIPPSSIVEEYEEQVCDMFQKNIECSKENRELSSLRDFLLPMLMNGQVTFKDN